jgi:xylulokinase
MNSDARCVLGIDLGTSSLKCLVIDDQGCQIASSERSYPTHAPYPGWAEQDPSDWIEALRGALGDLLRSDPGLFARLEAIGLCSAAHIPVLLNGKNEVIRPAILWSDQRSEAEVAFLNENHGDVLEATTLNAAGCTWTLPQLLWVWNNEPAVLSRVCRFLSSKDYLIFRLTGKSSMDTNSAAATLMMDAKKKEWSSSLTTLSRMPETVFPPLVSPMDVVGTISEASARVFGLPQGLRVVAGMLDSAAELVGCGILTPGQLGMVRVGSAGGVMAVTDKPFHSRSIITYPHVVEGLFYKQAGTISCATSLKWIRRLAQSARDENSPELGYEWLDQLASETKPGAEGLIFHPYIQGERTPYWNPELRGSFTGIDQRHGWPQFVRAVMEGVAYSLLDCMSTLRQDGLDMTSVVLAGGVTKSTIWAQIITDVLGLETRTIRQGDSVLGACMIAAVGIGMFESIEKAGEVCVHCDKFIVPDLQNHALYARLFERYQKTGRFLDALSKNSNFDDSSQLSQ